MISIAIVEDEDSCAKQMEEYLARYADESGEVFETVRFCDGDEILENYRAQYDIILMDVQMKFMDGMTAAEEIRKVDLGGIAILYAYHLQRAELQVRHELETMDSILRSQYAQYQQSRESIDLINRKYHDLKHQIAALRAEPDAERRSAWLDEMESDINTYEAQNKTGNQVLDVLLTGKSLYCQKHDIHLTTVADGTVLAGVSPMDLCTLVGNALDNAIESVKKIEDKEKRLIHVAVSRQKNFALLRFENCFEGELTFENGLPRTTKGNTDYHGYGLKSIRRTAQKYGGTVTVNTRKNWFELKILLPLAEGTQEK